jgi:hypothetical protein
MAYIQKTPLPNEVKQFSLNDFSGGLNNRTNLVAPNEASNMINLSYYDTSILEKRRGTTLFSPAFHGEPITFLDEYEPYNDATQIVRGGNNKISFDNGGVISGITLNNQGVDGENFLGMYFFADGKKFRCYGKFPQTSGTFTRILGAPYADFLCMEIVSTPANYTPLDTSYAQGVTVYDYNNAKVWYEPCLNEKNDPYKGVSVIPSSIRYITSLRGRMYTSGSNDDDDNVFISDVGNPFYFPPTLPISVPPNADAVRGLIVYNDSVIVGRKHDLHLITGQTNNPELGLAMFEMQQLNAHSGFSSNKAVTVAHNYLFYIGYDGNAYAMSNTSTSGIILSTVILNKKVDFMGYPFALSHEDIAGASAIFTDNVWYVSIKGYVFCYYYLNKAWTVWNNLDVRSFHVQDYTLLMGNEAGQVIKQSTDYLDQGNSYDAFYQTGSIDLNEAYLEKYFRTFFLVHRAFKGYVSPVNISFELDYSMITNTFTVDTQLAIWGVAHFGEPWGSKETNITMPFTIGRRARTIKIKVYADSGNTPLRFYQINGEYEIRGKR